MFLVIVTSVIVVGALAISFIIDPPDKKQVKKVLPSLPIAITALVALVIQYFFALPWLNGEEGGWKAALAGLIFTGLLWVPMSFRIFRILRATLTYRYEVHLEDLGIHVGWWLCALVPTWLLARGFPVLYPDYYNYPGDLSDMSFLCFIGWGISVVLAALVVRQDIKKEQRKEISALMGWIGSVGVIGTVAIVLFYIVGWLELLDWGWLMYQMGWAYITLPICAFASGFDQALSGLVAVRKRKKLPKPPTDAL